MYWVCNFIIGAGVWWDYCGGNLIACSSSARRARSPRPLPGLQDLQRLGWHTRVLCVLFSHSELCVPGAVRVCQWLSASWGKFRNQSSQHAVAELSTESGLPTQHQHHALKLIPGAPSRLQLGSGSCKPFLLRSKKYQFCANTVQFWKKVVCSFCNVDYKRQS